MERVGSGREGVHMRPPPLQERGERVGRENGERREKERRWSGEEGERGEKATGERVDGRGEIG